MNPKEAMVRITEGLALLLRQNDDAHHQDVLRDGALGTLR